MSAHLRHNHTVLSVFDLSPRRIGGIETMARELSVQLGERGWKSVLCFRSEPSAEVQSFLSLPNVEFEVLAATRRWSLSTQRQLASLLTRRRPAILHLNFVDLFAPYAMLARACGVKQVYFTDHISRPAEFIAQRSSRFRRAAYRIGVPVTKVLCVSDYLRRCWVEADVLADDRFETVYNGVDLQRCADSRGARSRFRAAYGIPPDAVLVTQVSSLIDEKGCATFIKSARQVCDEHPAVQFVLAGDGRQRGEYEALAERLGLGDKFRFLGLVRDPVKEGLFAGSDIICQASNWQEAFGLSIAEAMACSKPVVATRVGGIPELVRDRVSGILVNRGDDAALARGILELAASSDLRAQFGEAGQRWCAAQFDHRVTAKRVLDIYELDAYADSPGRAVCPTHLL